MELADRIRIAKENITRLEIMKENNQKKIKDVEDKVMNLKNSISKDGELYIDKHMPELLDENTIRKISCMSYEDLMLLKDKIDKTCIALMDYVEENLK